MLIFFVNLCTSSSCPCFLVDDHLCFQQQAAFLTRKERRCWCLLQLAVIHTCISVIFLVFGLTELAVFSHLPLVTFCGCENCFSPHPAQQQLSGNC